MGGGGKGGGSSTNVTQRELSPIELANIQSSTDMNKQLANIAAQQDARSAAQYADYNNIFRPVIAGTNSTDPNLTLNNAIFQANRDSTSQATDFSNKSSNLANLYSSGVMGIANNMGQADSDLLGLNKANALNGVGTSYDIAGRNINADMARRGLSNSGVADQMQMTNEQARAQGLSGANNQAYTNAITQSDARRTNQQAALGTGYGAVSNALGSSLNAQTAAETQRIANLSNYAQLGMGIGSSAQNYLGQAGQSYSQGAQNYNNVANSQGQLNNSHQASQMQANSQDNQASATKAAGTAQGIGALGGAGLMKYSDIRLKKNIERVGTLPSGLGVYDFDYIWGGDRQRGVMAQEVIKIIPDAVIERNGYYMVDYSKVV